MSSYLYYDSVITSQIAINAGFTVVAPPANPRVIYAIAGVSSAIWSFSTDAGVTQFDVPANTVYTINVKDPYGKITFKNSAAIQVGNYGMNAG